MIAGSDFGDNLYNTVSHHPEVANLTSLTLESFYKYPFLADSDNLINFPANIKTVVDVLEKAGVSWRAYAEGCKLIVFKIALSICHHSPLLICIRSYPPRM
jgi:hypothetical protein